jgi:hypothetical protein
MAKKMNNNMMSNVNDMMGEIFSQILAETAKAGEVERKMIEDNLFFGDTTDDDADGATDFVATDFDDADFGYLDFSFRAGKMKHGNRVHQKDSKKNRNKVLYDIRRKVSRYAHRDFYDHDDKTNISPVFHGKDVPVAFIKKSDPSYASVKKILKKSEIRKLRHKKLDFDTEDFAELDFIFEPDTEYVEGWPQKRPELMDITDFSVLYALDNGRRNPHLMTKISELSEGIHEYKAWITAQIMVCQFDIAWLNGEIEALEIRREQTMKELRDLLG